MKCYIGESYNNYIYWLTGEKIWSESSMHFFLGKSNICVCGKAEW